MTTTIQRSVWLSCALLAAALLATANRVAAQSYTLIRPVSATATANPADAPKTIDDNPNECSIPTVWSPLPPGSDDRGCGLSAPLPCTDPCYPIDFDLGAVKPSVVGFQESAGRFLGNRFHAFVSTDGLNFGHVSSGTLAGKCDLCDFCSSGQHFFSARPVRFFRILVESDCLAGGRGGVLADFLALLPANFPLTLGITQVQIFPSGAEKVQVQGAFTLDAASDNINPPGETVALSINRSDSSQAYPTSYVAITNGFESTSDGWSLSSSGRSQSGVQAFNIKRTADPRQFTFHLTDTQAMVSQANHSLVTVKLRIGNDEGQANVGLRQQSNGNWIYP